MSSTPRAATRGVDSDTPAPGARHGKRRRSPSKSWRQQWPLQAMVLPGILFVVVFSYLPMYGLVAAFQNYDVVSGFIGSEWVGLAQFTMFFQDASFWSAFWNTLAINGLNLAFGFVSPIILALMIYELKDGWFKKATQTISYLPHFLSWVILGGMVISWLMSDGLVNQALLKLGVIDQPILFMIEPRYYWWIAVLSNIWKEVGWGTILYLAAMAGIDPGLYEAAKVDGAGRLRQIWSITLPSIRGIITLMLVLSVGGLLGSNVDQTMILKNAENAEKAEVLGTYVITTGLSNGDFSYATAIGLFLSVIALVTTLLSYYLTRRLNDRSIF